MLPLSLSLRRSAPILACSFVLAAASLLSPLDARAQVLSGTVYDWLTGDPVPGANVTATGGEGVEGSLTDENGHYRIDLAGTGNYTVEASATGYAAQSIEILVEGGRNQDFYLHPAETSQIIVTNANDAGDGSLREALLQANRGPGLSTIAFNIPGEGSHTIHLATALPTITSPVIIDGYTQPGAEQNTSPSEEGTNAVLQIELNGADVVNGSGLHITGGGSTVRGLVINRFGLHGILIGENGGNSIEGNFIGTDVTGSAALGNGSVGVNVVASSGNSVGGAATGTRNLVSGQSNSSGIQISSGGSDNVVQGNLVGTDATGRFELENGTGISVSNSASNVIGGTDTAVRNVVSGSRGGGIVLSGSATSNNEVTGNYVGTNAAGTAAIPNNVGIVVSVTASNNQIGGALTEEGNVISGNRSDGILILGAAIGNVIQGNRIGTTADGTTALGNRNGIFLDSGSGDDLDYPSNTLIGGEGAGEGNLIAYNDMAGVAVLGGLGNGILSNAIHSNGELGIDLGQSAGVSDGVTENDQDDSDEGANALQNYPVLNQPVFDEGFVTVSGTISPAYNSEITLQLFANDTCDLSGHGEGQAFLGSITLQPGATMFEQAFDFAVGQGPVITATATDAQNNTSEFSRCPQGADVSVPDGYLADVLSEGFSQPQGMAMDGSGNLIVAASGSGEIYGVDPSGDQYLIAVGFSRPIDVIVIGDTAFVSDLDYNGIFAVPLTFDGIFDVDQESPVAFGFDGPTHLATSDDGAVYLSVVRGETNDHVLRVDLETGDTTRVIGFETDANPQGMDFLDGYLYLANQFPGTVTRTIPNGFVEGTTLPVILSGLDSPGGLAFGLGDRLYVATRDRVVRRLPGMTTWDTFLTGLSGDDFNDVFIADNGVMYVADRAGGRIIRVAAPKSQRLPTSTLTYMVNADGSPTITDGTDFTAIDNAFARWENVPTATIDFTNGGQTPLNKASASDGTNLVTFTDTDFLFTSQTLAVTAKTLVLRDDGETADIADVDIVVNPSFVNHPIHPLTTTGSDEEFDIEAVLAHEIGHLLGRTHTVVPSATMFYAIPKGPAFRTLEADDVAHVSHDYPVAGYDPNAIEGAVTDGNTGDPVAGAFVIAVKDGAPEIAVHAYTDENGVFSIPGVDAGNHRVIMGSLDGDVWGYNMVPMNVSLHHHLITQITRFPVEWYNAPNESGNPAIDSTHHFIDVAVNSVTSGIDFITNQDLTPPVIEAYSPVDGTLDVPATASIVFAFSEPIDTASVANAFTFEDDGGEVPGEFMFINDDQTALFIPDAPLSPGALYSFSLAATVQDKNANTMVTGTGTVNFSVDDVGPEVTLVTPSTNLVDVFVTTDVKLVFSEAIQTSSMAPRTPADSDNGFALLESDGTPLDGLFTFSLGNTVATFKPGSPLKENEQYSIVINDGATADPVTDASGNPVSTFTSAFTTVEEAAPQVVLVGPQQDDDDVTVETPILVDFSEPVDTESIATDPTSAANSSFVLTSGVSPVDGTFEYLNNDSRLIFRPSSDLAFNTTYTVTLKGGAGLVSVTDADGNAMAADTSWSFTTAGEPTEPDIAAVTPASGTVGTTVVISGTGFDPDPNANNVTFGGVPATVVSSTLSSILTSVPEGAMAGPLVVEVGGLSDSFEFGIVEPVDLDDAATYRVSSPTKPNDADITPDGGTAWIVNSAAGTVNSLDLVTLETGAPITVGDTPLRIAITPDGMRAYVTNFGSHSATMINLVDLTTAEIPTGLNPVGVAISPDGANVYVSEYTSESISVLDGDPASGAFNNATARISSGAGNSEITITPDGGLALVAGTMGVTIIDLDPLSPTYNSAVARVSSDTPTKAVSISPDGGLAAAVTEDGGMIIIEINASDPAASSAVARVSSSANVSDVEFGPDGATIFAATLNGTITVYQVTEPDPTIGAKSGIDDRLSDRELAVEVIGSIPIEEGAQNMALDPTTHRIVTANAPEGGAEGSISVVRFDLTVQEQIKALLQKVDDLIASYKMCRKGIKDKICLIEGIALKAPLVAALLLYENGYESWAVNRLEAFIARVEYGVRKQRLTEETGDELISDANAIIDAIGVDAAKGTPPDILGEELPNEFALQQNYPNPFNPTTTIEYAVPSGLDGPVRVRLEVYNLLGQRVATLVNQEQGAGRYSAVWDGRTAFGAEAASGVYLFRIEAGDFRSVKKMTLLR